MAPDIRSADIALAHLRCLPESCFPASRVLFWHEPEPGSKVASTLEGGQVRCECSDRQSRDRADPRHGLRPTRQIGFFRSALHLSVKLRNPSGQAINLFQIQLAKLSNVVWQSHVFVSDGVRKPLEMGGPPRRDQAMLGQVSTQGVDHLGTLANEHLPCPKEHRAGLLIFRLYGDKARGRTQRRLNDRIGIGSVVLLPLDEGPRIDWRDQADLMSQLPEFPAQPCVVAQASMALTHSGCRAMNASN